MITFSFLNDSDRGVVEFLEQSTPRILAAIEPAMLRAMADLKNFIQSDKLQGQVLKSHKNGAGLAGSLNIRVERDGDVSIAGYVGTNLVYAPIHEYGFSGSETVRSFTRRQTMAWGRSISPRDVTVKSFTRNMVMPQRAYMAPSLAEKAEAITARIRAAIVEAIETA